MDLELLGFVTCVALLVPSRGAGTITPSLSILILPSIKTCGYIFKVQGLHPRALVQVFRGLASFDLGYLTNSTSPSAV